VVQRRYPNLPRHPLLAAAWVALLAGGALDAELNPEKASAAIKALWAATLHPHAAVSATSCTDQLYRSDIGGEGNLVM
jgi:hypothetical protein